ncbi:MAG: polyphosphate polymerase domain-containing protein, partial [Spirochaetes bacterium]|nr:polyphosphate polymerase domain-containing protein [Spirochaetota bacterium]
YPQYHLLKNLLSDIISRDPHQINSKGYLVRSLYFDNIFNKNYYEKIEGYDNRKKYRMRTYDINAKEVKFEIKNKVNDYIYKEASVISKKDAIDIISNKNYDSLLNYNSKVLNKIYLAFKLMYYSPVVLIDYSREAFIFPNNNVRITLDSSFMKNEIDLNIFSKQKNMIPFNKNKIILEIKYDNNFPSWLKKVLRNLNLDTRAISKYCLARTI